MMKLRQAVEARMPLLCVRTVDQGNIHKMLLSNLEEHKESLKKVKLRLGRAFHEISKEDIFSDETYWCIDTGKIKWPDVYPLLGARTSTMIVVNPQEKTPEMYDCGDLICGPRLIQAFVSRWYKGPSSKADVMRGFSGLTYREMAELFKLTSVQYPDMTVDHLQKVRREYAGLPSGIHEVDTRQEYYVPNEQLEEWTNVHGKIFQLHDNPRLVPRGLMMSGDTGTGKTEGAKYVSRELGLSLYRLDLGDVFDKWAGESDRRLKAGLQAVENASPCVMLIDEVDKIFPSSSDSEITGRLLGYLLWWLQEHKSKVLTIMTRNLQRKVPAELYREGRVSQEVFFTGIEGKEAQEKFVYGVLASLPEIPSASPAAIILELFNAQADATVMSGHWTMTSYDMRSQAALTEMALNAYRKKLLEENYEL